MVFHYLEKPLLCNSCGIDFFESRGHSCATGFCIARRPGKAHDRYRKRFRKLRTRVRKLHVIETALYWAKQA